MNDIIITSKSGYKTKHITRLTNDPFSLRILWKAGNVTFIDNISSNMFYSVSIHHINKEKLQTAFISLQR